MCGIVGFWSFRDDVLRCSQDILDAMADAVTHRGPDDDGVWFNTDGGIGLGHRRLSIIDRSEGGRQPMHSADERYVLAYNGELYNFEQLRQELLDGVDSLQFRGHSDTEVLLESIAHYGLEPTLKRANGMFAFALWDKKERTLTLARDRIGIKPLYYGRVGGDFVFTSELRPLTAYPGFQGRIARQALDLFVRHAAVPTPHCIFEGFRKLVPGTYLQLHSPDDSPEPVTYWSPWEKRFEGLNNQIDFTDPVVSDDFEALLTDAVRRRMIADVPLGAFLSGGIDSSLVVALMQKVSDQPVKTFTIGFESEQFNEAPHAAAVADALGADHTELYVTDDEVLDIVPQLPRIADEPLGDSSLIPTSIVSQLARRDVTVSLSGDGGDELFGGYGHYRMGRKWAERTGWLPRPLRRYGGALVAEAGTTARTLTSGFEVPAAVRHQFDRAAYFGGLVSATGRDPMALYWHVFRYWNDVSELVRGVSRSPVPFEHRLAEASAGSLGQKNGMMLADTLLYLPDVLLTKLDRASMNVGLEARVPLLDHRVVERAWQIPVDQKIDGQQGKLPLREVLYRHVDRKLIERPKQGFSVPLAQWLRGPLCDWGEELLRESRLRADGFFHPRPIRLRWERHLGSEKNCQHDLWNILVFQSWKDAFPTTIL